MPVAKKTKPKLKLHPPPPLWAGPIVDGVTQSMLRDWLVCRERYRVKYLLGLKPVQVFSIRVEFGNLWHVCEEHFAKGGDDWCRYLNQACRELAIKYPMSRPEIQKWYEIILRQFPIYMAYWAKNPDVKLRTPLMQEQVFDVPYKLPSGRVVRLRGKFDSVDLIGKEGIYLQENKTKGRIDPQMMRRQLVYDLQTMTYLVALWAYKSDPKLHGSNTYFAKYANMKLAGIRYNVIRRPLSGGKHSISQHQPTKANPQGESESDFYDRLAGLIQEDVDEALRTKQDAFFFMRWKVDVYPSDIVKFEQQTLIPILEQLCDWYEWVTSGPTPFGGIGIVNSQHFRTPFGIYSPLLDGGATDYDEFLLSGNQAGLERVESLFGEL